MGGLLSALRFLTLLPLGKDDRFDPRAMLPFFPVVGVIVGLLLAGLDALALRLWPGNLVAVLDTLFLVAITGALHLDGLADTADGLYGHRSKARALEIMKDSRVGAMGLVAVICGLGLKWGGIDALADGERFLVLVVVPAYARAGMLFGFKLMPYGRAEDGTGQAFFDTPPAWRDFWGLIIPVGLSLLLGGKGLLLILSFFTLIYIVLAYYKRKLGCITGDMLGAMGEMTEALLFVMAGLRVSGAI